MVRLIAKILIVVNLTCTILLCGYGIVVQISDTDDVVTQIINGDIDNFDSGSKEGISVSDDGVYTGSGLYKKAQMIYNAIRNDKSAEELLIRDMPEGMYNRFSSKLSSKNIIELYILFNEMVSVVREDEGLKKYSPEFDIALLYGTLEAEDGFLRKYRDYGEDSFSIFKAYDYDYSSNGTYKGPYQMHTDYFNTGAYWYYISMFENSSIDNSRRFGTSSRISKNDLRFSINQRANTSGSNPCFYFPDITAYTIASWSERCYEWASKIDACCEYYNIDAGGRTFLYTVASDYRHRGAFNPIRMDLAIGENGKISNPSTYWLASFYVELAKSGVYKDLITMEYSNNREWQAQCFTNDGCLAEQLQKINSCGFNTIWKGKSHKDVPGIANTINYEYTCSSVIRYSNGMKYLEQTEFYIEQWFALLGLTTDIDSSSVVIGENKGQFQGFWTDVDGAVNSAKMMEYVYRLNSATQVEMVKHLEYVGVSNKTNNPVLRQDKYKVYGDDIGFIYYRQSSYSRTDCDGFNWLYTPWVAKEVKIGDSMRSTNLGTMFCGGFCTSMVMSTMLHRYVSPSEIVIAGATYHDRHNTPASSLFYNGMFPFTSMELLFNDMKFNGKPMFTCTNLELGNDKDQIIEKINNGGMGIVILDSKSGVTSGGHYVIIREITEDGKALLGNSSYSVNALLGEPKNMNTEWDWERLLNGSSGARANVLVIEPAEGLIEYRLVASGGSSTSTMYSISKNALTILSNAKIVGQEFLDSRDKWGNSIVEMSDFTVSANSYGFLSAVLELSGHDTSKLSLQSFRNREAQSVFKSCDITEDWSKVSPGSIVVFKKASKYTVGIMNQNNYIYLVESENSRKLFESGKGIQISELGDSLKSGFDYALVWR